MRALEHIERHVPLGNSRPSGSAAPTKRTPPADTHAASTAKHPSPASSQGTSRAHTPGKHREAMRTGEGHFCRSARIGARSPGQGRATELHPQSHDATLTEFQGRLRCRCRSTSSLARAASSRSVGEVACAARGTRGGVGRFRDVDTRVRTASRSVAARWARPPLFNLRKREPFLRNETQARPCRAVTRLRSARKVYAISMTRSCCSACDHQTRHIESSWAVSTTAQAASKYAAGMSLSPYSARLSQRASPVAMAVDSTPRHSSSRSWAAREVSGLVSSVWPKAVRRVIAVSRRVRAGAGRSR